MALSNCICCRFVMMANKRSDTRKMSSIQSSYNLISIFLISAVLLVLNPSINIHNQVSSLQVDTQNQNQNQQQQKEQQVFPGVARELASFCAARPSLSIDLASMVVHVKRNTSFNYKLYLFSTDHIFQTGQVIPRADFRIHSFPVKIKHLNEFWSPTATPTYKYSNLDASSRVQVPASSFNLRSFLKRVPLNPNQSSESSSSGKLRKSTSVQTRQKRKRVRANGDARGRRPSDLHWDSLPGDERLEEVGDEQLSGSISAASRAPTIDTSEQLNKHIKFDRDDQVSALQRRTLHAPVDYIISDTSTTSGQATDINGNQKNSSNQNSEFFGDSILPIGSFSAFHVNSTYMVRKDFDQLEAQIIKIKLDPQEFKVDQVQIISDGSQNSSSYPQNEDYNFLSHQLFRDSNTRITAINQIYEDWITRNYYTIVYIQRRLPASDTFSHNERPEFKGNNETKVAVEEGTATTSTSTSGSIINERLIFRGSSIALLGAEQLDYSVKAAAFITEKNGLHYYLEFLHTNKFHLCAVDWSRRPFKMIDSRQFPIKATRTQLDNEELLLCPPAVCYSNQPIDEIISYNRLILGEQLERQLSQLISGQLSGVSASLTSSTPLPEITTTSGNLLPAGRGAGSGSRAAEISSPPSSSSTAFTSTYGSRLAVSDDDLLGQPTIALPSPPVPASNLQSATSAVNNQQHNHKLDILFESLRAGASQLETKLHLRDWVWLLAPDNQSPVKPLAISNNGMSNSNKNKNININDRDSGNNQSPANLFHWRYELARRNDIKVKPDTYGYVLTGHEIDASYRVYNELYLITANHLITINYTLANETVTSSHLIGEEFPGLSSTLIDPITGAFYDRYTNQIYFFKGDRYVGYDYATKRPLEDFLLQAPGSSYSALVAGGGAASSYGGSSSSSNGNNENQSLTNINMNNSPLVTSLPVIGILGRQHHVDAIYHDFSSDLVFIFTGMRFYSFEARKFKDGIFNSQSQLNGEGLPRMYCINTHFLSGCNFDRAYTNPCHDSLRDEKQDTAFNGGGGGSGNSTRDSDDRDKILRGTGINEYDNDSDRDFDDEREFSGNENSLDPSSGSAFKELNGNNQRSSSNMRNQRRKNLTEILDPTNKDSAFTEDQQQKLRSIASRGGLLDALLDPNSHMARLIDPLSGGGVMVDNLDQQSSRPQELVIIYLLIAMVGLTIFITVAMIIVLINWSRNTKTNQELDMSSPDSRRRTSLSSTPRWGTNLHLANQHQYFSAQRQQQQSLPAQHPLDRRPQPSLPLPPPLSDLTAAANAVVASNGLPQLRSYPDQQEQYLYHQPQYLHQVAHPQEHQQQQQPPTRNTYHQHHQMNRPLVNGRQSARQQIRRANQGVKMMTTLSSRNEDSIDSSAL